MMSFLVDRQMSKTHSHINTLVTYLNRVYCLLVVTSMISQRIANTTFFCHIRSHNYTNNKKKTIFDRIKRLQIKRLSHLVCTSNELRVYILQCAWDVVFQAKRQKKEKKKIIEVQHMMSSNSIVSRINFSRRMSDEFQWK